MAPPVPGEDAKTALALFGSTSPSYLTLLSLDRCNRYLSEGYWASLEETAQRLEKLREALRHRGWKVLGSDPLRITLAAPDGLSGSDLAERLRRGGVECEFADRDFLVLMATPENREEDFLRLIEALGENTRPAAEGMALPLPKGEQVCSIRQAFFAPHQPVPAREALGRICAAPTVSCPPAIPIAISGERLGEEALALFAHYGVETVDVLL